MTHPSYLGWQVDWPIFVKTPFTADGKNWKRQEHFNWLERNLNEDKVATLYNIGYLYHNPDLQVQNKVGDRLVELDQKQLTTLVGLLNAKVKIKTSTKVEFDNKKCKSSSITDKQRGLIRRFLMSNPWIAEDFQLFRDSVLKGTSSPITDTKEETTEVK